MLDLLSKINSQQQARGKVGDLMVGISLTVMKRSDSAVSVHSGQIGVSQLKNRRQR